MKKNFMFSAVLILSLLTFIGCGFEDIDGTFTGDSNTGASGSITKFAVHNGYMYALNPNEVLTYDLSNEDKPELIHQLATDYGLETIFIYDDAIYLGSRTSLYILDISTPHTPILLSKTDRSIQFFNGCDPVVVQDNIAYSTIKVIQNVCGDWNSRSALLVYDVTNKRNPREIGDYPLNEPNGLGLFNQYLFVCDAGSDEVRVFDISEPNALVELPELAIPITNPVDIIINNGKMIVSAQTYFQIYNITDVRDITPVGRVDK